MKHEKLIKLNKEIVEKYNHKELVLGDGKEDSIIMMVGEAPGAKEVEYKKPFVGSAGKYLDEFLSILNLEKDKLYITNTVKFRPTKEGKRPGTKTNRPPSKKEIEEFKEFLLEEIDIVRPKIVVTLGNVPLKTLTNNDEVSIGSVHGSQLNIKIKEVEYILFPLYHPAAVIYRRELKEVYLKDLKKLADLLRITI